MWEWCWYNLKWFVIIWYCQQMWGFGFKSRFDSKNWKLVGCCLVDLINFYTIARLMLSLILSHYRIFLSEMLSMFFRSHDARRYSRQGWWGFSLRLRDPSRDILMPHCAIILIPSQWINRPNWRFNLWIIQNTNKFAHNPKLAVFKGNFIMRVYSNFRIRIIDQQIKRNRWRKEWWLCDLWCDQFVECIVCIVIVSRYWSIKQR